MASLLGTLLTAAVVAGFLGAGLFMPIVGTVGASVRTAVDLFNSLPDELDVVPPSEQSRILDASGAVIATPSDENRRVVALSEIAPVMRDAQIAIEDHRFYEHGGADLQGILRSAISNSAAGKVTGGGSTLTQQYVKTTLQYSALSKGDKDAADRAIEQTYARKIQELKYAISLEKKLTKDQILESYLNLVYYGDQAYGVEAASQHYFGHSAKEITLPEAALLAGIVRNPSYSDPINHPKAALSRRDIVLDQMLKWGYIDKAAWQKARAVKLEDMIKEQNPQNSCTASPYPYFCDYVINWLKLDPSLDAALGATPEARHQAIYRGGLTIKTTLDPTIMEAAQEEVLARVPIGSTAPDGAAIGAAAAVVDSKNGAVKAIAQNTTYSIKPTNPSETVVNYAVDEKYGASIGFGFGSTAKAFALVAVLEAGFPTQSTVFAKGATRREPAVFTTEELTGYCGLDYWQWRVRNDRPTKDSNMSLAEAVAKSNNTAFVGLVVQKLKGDVCKVREAEGRLGLHQATGEPIKHRPSSIILGTDSVSPLNVAGSYQTLANEGTHCTPRPVVEILKGDKPLDVPPLGSQCEARVDPDVARGVTRLLTNVFGPRSDAAGSALSGGRPAAGKTGTTDGGNETWFVGYTPDLVTSVWVGTPNDPNNQTVLSKVNVGDRYYADVHGATIAAPIWKAIMDRSLADTPKTKFTRPSTKIIQGEKVSVPNVVRLSITDATAVLHQAGFTAKRVNTYSGYRVDTVVSTSPRRIASRGSEITLYVSMGPPPPPPPPPPTSPPPTPTPPTPTPPTPPPPPPPTPGATPQTTPATPGGG